MKSKKNKSQFMTKEWKLFNCNWGVQIVEGNRVIVALSEPNSKDHGPRRTEDVMERAMAILALPDLLKALKDILEGLDDEFQPAFIYSRYTERDMALINAAREAIAKLESRPIPPSRFPEN